MSNDSLKCPNCGAPRKSGATSCPSCGIVYTKFAAKQRKLQEIEYEKLQQAEKSRTKLPGYAAASLAVIVTLYFTFSGEEGSEPIAAAEPNISHSNPYSHYNPNQSKKLVSDEVKNSLQASTFTVRNSSLRYPSNSGGAVIITNNCQALTGWKISDTDNSSSTETRLRNQLNRARHNIDRYQAIIEEKRRHFLDGCTDCSQEAFDRKTRRERQNLELAEREYTKAMQRMSSGSKKSSTLSATINNNSHNIRVDERIKSLGLALLWIEDATHCSPATIGEPSKLEVGDKVFMMTGAGRISDGVITGFATSRRGYNIINHTARTKTVGHVAGTPLFNDKGEVFGINIPAIGKDRNAVSIEDVLDEFNLVL
ncbi:MAG: hypothetical protein ACQETD_02985 [Pseudomonadota bacterium]